MPGVAHAAAFWRFLILPLRSSKRWATCSRLTVAFLSLGRWAVVGFREDAPDRAVLGAVSVFSSIRIVDKPGREPRGRFFGSQARTAWVVLALISMVVVGLLV